MTEVLPHPAESAEFLSRLHDRELSPAELAAYRSHVSECPQCRAAEEAFEQALSAYREAPEFPPAADLSARILRKLRAQTPMRRPFGVAFGIDIRWAGLVAAALLVFLISAPIVLRRPKPAQPPVFEGYIGMAEEDSSTATATADDANEAPGAAAAPAAPPASREQAAGAGRREDAPFTGSKDRAKAEGAPPELASPPAFAADRPLEAKVSEPPAQTADAPAERLRQEIAAAAPLGASEAQANRTLSKKAAADAPRLAVQASDDRGEPPALSNTPPDDRLAPLRGRSFVIFVEPDGRVREVSEAFSRDELASKENPGGFDLEKRSDETEVLEQLVFASGDSPRRLLVSVH